MDDILNASLAVRCAAPILGLAAQCMQEDQPMTVRNLEFLLSPRSIALIGASIRPGSVGLITARNLVSGGFSGPVWLVNPKYRSIEGHDCYSSVGALPAAPDLAVIVTPPQPVPQLIQELGAKGTRAAV